MTFKQLLDNSATLMIKYEHKVETAMAPNMIRLSMKDYG